MTTATVDNISPSSQGHTMSDKTNLPTGYAYHEAQDDDGDFTGWVYVTVATLYDDSPDDIENRAAAEAHAHRDALVAEGWREALEWVLGLTDSVQLGHRTADKRIRARLAEVYMRNIPDDAQLQEDDTP